MRPGPQPPPAWLMDDDETMAEEDQ
jgi:hypothetical protein